MFQTCWMTQWTVMLTATVSASLLAAEPKTDGVKLTEQAGKVRIEINGEHFTDYVFQGAPHVYFYPLLGRAGYR